MCSRRCSDSISSVSYSVCNGSRHGKIIEGGSKQTLRLQCDVYYRVICSQYERNLGGDKPMRIQPRRRGNSSFEGMKETRNNKLFNNAFGVRFPVNSSPRIETFVSRRKIMRIRLKTDNVVMNITMIIIIIITVLSR